MSMLKQGHVTSCGTPEQPKRLTNSHFLNGYAQNRVSYWVCLPSPSLICADGTSLSPTLIYKAVSGNLRDTWLDDFEPSRQSCYSTSSPNGWTSDELGYSWLAGPFEKETAVKAKRS